MLNSLSLHFGQLWKRISFTFMAGNLPVVNCDKNGNYRGHTEHSADQYHENFDS